MNCHVYCSTVRNYHNTNNVNLNRMSQLDDLNIFGAGSIVPEMCTTIDSNLSLLICYFKVFTVMITHHLILRIYYGCNYERYAQLPTILGSASCIQLVTQLIKGRYVLHLNRASLVKFPTKGKKCSSIMQSWCHPE